MLPLLCCIARASIEHTRSRATAGLHVESGESSLLTTIRKGRDFWRWATTPCRACSSLNKEGQINPPFSPLSFFHLLGRSAAASSRTDCTLLWCTREYNPCAATVERAGVVREDLLLDYGVVLNSSVRTRAHKIQSSSRHKWEMGSNCRCRPRCNSFCLNE